MWPNTVLILGTSLLLGTASCDGTSQHSRPSVSRPTAPLVWGDINILHTTDSHGWLGGHTKATPPEPNYSADLGMFSSFVSHMKAEAEVRNVDLLLVDSGDLHDGNGITDGFPTGDVNGHEALKLIAHLPYDVLAVGNHELYKYSVAYDMYKNFAPKWNGRYLTSNVNITLRDENGRVFSVPLGSRSAKFKTRLGRSVTALGVLFNFTMNSPNTTVQPPAEMVKESWFKEVIADEPDIFLLAGHMPVHMDNWPVIFDAIRAVHPQTPILIFGGHTHIRDCVQFDGRSMALASGRYMETIGWMSVELGNKGSTDNVTFSRRYLDANPVTYSYHTGKTGAEFHTEKGQQITADLQALSERFNLSYQFGIAPTDFFLDRVPISSPQSLLTLFVSQAIPTALSVSNPRESIPRMIVTNSGAIRYDLLKGSFTRNDQYIASPFTNTFQYLSNVSSSVAHHILDELNHSGLPARRKRGLYDNDAEALALLKQGDPTAMYQGWMREQWERWNAEEVDGESLTPGYVTKDACPGVGDDVLHVPLPYHPHSPFIGTTPSHSDAVDLIFASFIRDSVLQIVNKLNAGSRPNVTEADVATYSDLRIDQVLGVFATIKWN